MSKKKISNNLSEMIVDRIERNASSVFEITIPHEFGIGKNEVKINLTSNQAKKGSEILIDINDASGEPIYYEISPIANVDKSRSVIVEIDEETVEGKSQFILVTTLSNDQTYKCILDIPIVNGVESKAEIKFESEPVVIYQEKSLPTQKFTSTSRLVNRTFSGGTVSSIGTISPKQIQSDNLTVERPEITTRTKSNSVIGNIGSSSIQEIPTEFSLSTITGKNLAFSSSMKGGMILIKNINLEVPADALISTPFYFQNYSASIIEVNNTSSIQVYPPFFRNIEYQTSTGKRNRSFDRFFNEGNFTASFYDTLTLVQSTFTQSYASLDLFNLETVSGQVEKIEVSYKSLNNLGTDFSPIGKFEIGSPNLLVDSSSLFFDNELGIIEKPVGNFRGGLADFQTNWVSSSKGSFPVTSSISTRVKDGIRIQQNPLNTGSGEFSLFTPKQYHKIIVKEGSKFKIDADTFFERDSNFKPQLDVYISGSFVKSEITDDRIDFSPLQSSSFGQYIGSSFPITFTAEKSGDIQPVFVHRTGIVHIGNIEINSNNQSRIFVPMNMNSGSEISLKIDYLNSKDVKSRYSTIIDKIFFTGSKFPGGGSTITIPSGTVSGSDQLTSSFDDRYHKLGTGLLSSSNQIATEISGAFVSASNSLSNRIDNLTLGSGSFVLTSSYQLDSGSWNTKILNINNVTASYVARVQSLENTTGSLNTYTGSNNTRLNRIELTTGSLNTFTGSIQNQVNSIMSTTGSLNQYTSSANSKLTSLEQTSGSLNVFTGSATSRLNSIEARTGSYATTASNQFNGNQSISGSLVVSQSVRATEFTGVFNGQPSSSAQIKILLPTGTVSGSEQLTSSYDVRYERKGTGIYSSSAQIGPTGIYSGSGQVPRNTVVSASNLKFETNSNIDTFVSGFKFDAAYDYGTNNISDYSGSLIFYTGPDGKDSRAYIRMSDEEGLIDIATRELSSDEFAAVNIGNGTVSCGYVSGSQSTSFELSGPNTQFTDTRTNKVGIVYGGNYTASILANPSSLVDVRTVRAMFASASLISSSAQIASDISGSLNAYSGSTNSRLSRLELTSGSLNTYTGSNDTRLNLIEIKTGSYATTGSNTFRGNETISGSTLITGSLGVVGRTDINGQVFITGSLTHQLQYTWPGTITAGTTPGIIWTNMPAAKSTWLHQTGGTLTNDSVYPGNFTELSQCKLFTCVAIGAAGANATSSLIVDYTNDGGSSWNTLIQLTIGNTAGIKDSGWARIPANAVTESYIRLTGQGGDGTADPRFSPPILLLR